MNKKTRNIWIGIGAFFVLFFGVGGPIINKYHHENVRSKPEMYCYQTYLASANPVLIIENIKYKDALVNYHKKREAVPKSNPPIGVPLKTMPISYPVYVMKYTKDSLLANVVSYYDRGPKFGGSYTRGWVYADCLHKNPPPKKKK